MKCVREPLFYWYLATEFGLIYLYTMKVIGLLFVVLLKSTTTKVDAVKTVDSVLDYPV